MELFLEILIGTIAGFLLVGVVLYLAIGPKNFRKSKIGEVIQVVNYKEDDHKGKSDNEKISTYIHLFMKENPHLMKKEFAGDDDLLVWIQSIITDMTMCYVFQTSKTMFVSDLIYVRDKLKESFTKDNMAIF